MSSLLARIGARILPPWLRRQAPGYRVNWPMTSYQLGYGAPHRHLEITYSAVYAAIDRISSDVGRLPLRLAVTPQWFRPYSKAVPTPTNRCRSAAVL